TSILLAFAHFLFQIYLNLGWELVLSLATRGKQREVEFGCIGERERERQREREREMEMLLGQ
ncbi:hypothetical protein ACOSB0_00185, partial [Candidatus Phytoplasma citri]